MKPKLRKQLLIFLPVLLLRLTQPVTLSAGEGDAVIPFDESWAINISAKYVTAGFTPEQSGYYTTDLPWSLGLGVRYKNISASLYLPSFYALSANLFESFDIQLASYYDMFYYEAFCKRYQGFSDKEKIIDLNVLSSGISAGWVQNSKRHSLSAVYDLDGKQQFSSGSVILGFGVFYTSILGGDTSKHCRSSPYLDSSVEFAQGANSRNKSASRICDRNTRHLVYFGPNIGYSYTFLFSGNIFLNINLIIGLDVGIDMNTNKRLFIPQATPRISFGYHGNAWSINAAIGCNYTAFLRDPQAVDLLMPATMTLAYSKRF